MTATKMRTSNEELQAFLAQNQAFIRGMVDNASTLRSDLIRKLFDPRRDIDSECGYPGSITMTEYRQLYDREGLARKVVHFWPDECWALPPLVYETEDPDETEFELAWGKLLKAKALYHWLHKVDVISGIGSFGVLLLGIDDGLPLDQPLQGINERGERVGGGQQRELLYLRAFAEDFVTVDLREMDETNPRYGQPLMYAINFTEYGHGELVQSQVTKRVHWTRIIHVADARETSEVYGVPRMQPVFNRLMDVKKVLGGAAEMFWKGGFPGYALETHPELGDVELDTTSIRDEMQNMFNGLQRWLALTGLSVKSLAPQVANPSPHLEGLLDNIALTLGVPKRKFLGSEQAQLASSQDERTWNKRVRKRQTEYLSPMVVGPFVDRLIGAGVLPEVEEYTIDWPDLNTVTDEEKASVSVKVTEAMAKYVQGNVDQLIPPAEFLTIVMGFAQDEVEQILEAVGERELELERQEPIELEEEDEGEEDMEDDMMEEGEE